MSPEGMRNPSRGPKARGPRGDALKGAPPGRGAAWATGFALLFLSLSLAAMALVPMWLEGDVRDARMRIQSVLEPAERLAAKIQFAQARQMEAYHSFLLLGDANSRLRYRDARNEEVAALDTLGGLTEGMSLQVQDGMANFLTLSVSWHLGHQDMLSAEVSGGQPPVGTPTEDYRRSLTTERAAYMEVISAGESLRSVIALEAQEGERQMARARFLQTQISQILVVLGLVATVVVLILAWRLRTLMTELEARRREAIRARREADGLLRATGDGVMGVDLDGTCTFLNRAGAEMLGYSARFVVGRNVHELLHHSGSDGNAMAQGDCPFMKALAAGAALSSSNETFWRAGQRPFPVHLSLRPMMDGGELRGGVMSFTDMTETRDAEESLRRAVQARDEVLAVVSHDLRNPVGTIFSAASLLLTLDPAPEKRKEHLLAMKRSAERMNRLIQDLLDIARLESGVFKVLPSAFSAQRLVAEILESQKRGAEEAGVTLSADVPSDLPLARGDRHRIYQALMNLVDNAIRETPRDGAVTMGAEMDFGSDGIRFFVTDDGPGIRPEDRERLFDRFWQINRADKGGAGLGLSIVKGIVEAHGGRVGVDSVEGEGSTFFFILPGEEAAAG